jgi:short-subunit dehydrogenase
VTAPGAAEALAEAAERRFGRVDVWFNNAGVAPVGRFEEIPLADHLRTMEVNLGGVLSGSHAALRRFRAQGSGTLMNMASVEGRVPLALHASYAATKHAVIGLDGALREELRLAGLWERIRVLTILPWAVDTPFWGNAGTYTGREARGPWMDGAREAADAIAWAGIHAPSGEFPVGFKAEAAVLGAQLAPGPHAAHRRRRDAARAAGGGAAGREHVWKSFRAEPLAFPRRGGLPGAVSAARRLVSPGRASHERLGTARQLRGLQNRSPFFSSPCTPFSPFTVCVTWKSTASEQNW